MGKKYIIELEDKPFHKGNGDFLYRVKGFNSLVFDMTGIGKLTPYTEPDLEAIRNEAYEKGVHDTKQHWVDAPRSCAYKLGYENGLNDLWEAMQKAIKMYCEIDNEVFLRVFYDVKCDRGESVLQALFKNTPQHLIDSIREYEQEKEEEIQVGDEVVGTYTGEEETEPFVIIRKIPEINPTYYFGIYSKSGKFCQGGLKLKKTGRHFSEIAEVLRKMKE